MGIRGEKGGGAPPPPPPRTPVEDPNTLRSKVTARVIDVISEGEIEGLADGAKSIFFDDTPLQNPDNSFNFDGVIYEFREGLPDQAHIPGFPNVENEVTVNVEVKQSQSVTRTINQADADAVRVTIGLPAGLNLQELDSGDLKGTSVTIAIDVKPDGGSFSQVLSDTISGKTTSAYEKSYRVSLPANGSPWEVRVRRITQDNESVGIQDTTVWNRYTAIVDAKLIYPDSALIGITIDSQLFGGRIPVRSYEIKGLKVKVPSNYTPETRQYIGIWDGTFHVAYTDNPAWVFYDILTNSRYGIGEFLDIEQVDKFSLFDIGKYCDELVDNGFSGQEPRFTFNGVINTREEAYNVLQTISSAFRGMAYWGSGAVTATQDAPTDPVMLVSPANVVGGEFNYSSAGLKARHSVALVTWNDPADAYRAAIEVVEDPEMIKRFGWRETNVLAYGTTSRGQAHRLGKWILDSEKNETETVTYQTSLDHAGLRPGDVIEIADPSIAGVRYGGRVKSATISAITLDDSVDLTSGETYEISVIMPDGSIETSPVNNGAGNHTIINVGSVFPDVAVVNAMWIITGSDVAPRKFRVVSVRETEKHLFEVTALLHDSTKYARIEQDIVLEETNFTTLPTGIVAPPAGLTFHEYLFQEGVAIKTAVTISWEASTDTRVVFYELEIKKPGEDSFTPFTNTAKLSVDILDTIEGNWGLRVRAIDGIGRKSAFLTLDPATFVGILAPPGDIQSFRADVNGDITYLSWSPVTDLDMDHYVIKFSPQLSGATWGGSAILIEKIGKTTTSASTVTRAGTYLIKGVDASGTESVNPAVIINTIDGSDTFNVVETFNEHPGFTGVGNGVVSIDGKLRLDSVDKIEDWPSVDSVINLSLGINGVISSGTYNFANALDLGEPFTSRLTARIKIEGVNLRTGEAANTTDWAFQLQVRTTPDDPAGSPTWSDWLAFTAGEYTTRAFEWRVLLDSNNSDVTPLVEELTVEIDMPDRIVRGNDITASASGTHVTFTPAFRAVPAIAPIGQDLQTGDFWEVTNQTSSGFDIIFKNSGGTGVQRTFDYIASGYGRSGS